MPKPNRKVSQEEQQLVNDVAEFYHDPYGFALYCWPWGEGELVNDQGPDVWQAEILRAIRDGLIDMTQAIKLATSTGHGTGKSALVAMIIHWAMSTCRDCRGVVTANTEMQLKTKTWAELAKWHRLAINRHWFKLTATAYFSSNPEFQLTWRIDQVTWSENNTEAFAGLHNQGKRVLVIFDEGSAIPDKIWEVTEGALTDKDTDIIWAVFGNPTRSTGRFRDCFYKYKAHWITRVVDSRDCKHTNLKQIEEWIQVYGIDSDFVKVRVKGVFPSMSFKQFISAKDVDAAFGRELRYEQYNFAPIIITCDPAWEGDDELVIGMRQGLKFEILEVAPKNDNDILVATKLAKYEDDLDADAVFVDAGYGTGIVSAGRTLGRHWRLVWFNEESGEPGCINKRAEMWMHMRDWLKEGGSLPLDQVLYDDLIGPETVPRLDGKIQLESKQDMKKRKVPSPNRADSLGLSFAYPVKGDLKYRKRSGDGQRVSTSRLSKRIKSRKGEWDGSYQEVYAHG